MSGVPLKIHGMDWYRSGQIRGDGVRFGWRSLVGVILVAVLLLHGFDRSFVIDGYTMSILGLLVVLALAGELESARIGGFEVKFRKALLARLEQEVDAVVAEEEEESGEELEGEAEDQPDVDQLLRSPDLRSVAMADPGSAVIAFFEEMEGAIRDLFRPLEREGEEKVSIARRIDVLTRYGVVTASEARIVLDLVGLRNAYVHGSGVNPDEAARLVAIGARLLPSFSRARTRASRAFEEQVEQVLKGIPGIHFERQPVLPSKERWHLRSDFLITSPFRVIVEARATTDGAIFGKRLQGMETLRVTFPTEEIVVVVPWAARDFVERFEEKFSLRILPLDRLKDWLEQRVEDR